MAGGLLGHSSTLPRSRPTTRTSKALGIRYAGLVLDSTFVTHAADSFDPAEAIAGLREFKRQKRITAQPALWAVLLGALLPPLGMYLAFRWMAEAAQGPHVVVWVRKFHRSAAGVLRTKHALGRALWGYGSLVTISDSRVPGDLAAALRRLRWFLIVPGCAVLLLAAPGIAILAVLASGLGLNTENPLVTMALVVLGGTLSTIVALRLARRWLGKRTAGDEDPAATFEKAVNPIRLGDTMAMGASVIRCSDENWQPLVHEALRQADAVVIDAAGWSENVEWEAEAALRIAGPRKLILLYHPAPGVADSASYPDHLLNYQSRAVGSRVFATSDLPAYLAPSWGRSRRRMEALENALLEAIVAPRAPATDC